jgi:hypothetical protein
MVLKRNGIKININIRLYAAYIYLWIIYFGINNIVRNPTSAGIKKINCFVKVVIARSPN